MIHTPYDGSAPLFRIGLKPLAPEDWIEVDERLPQLLKEKARLATAHPQAVFAAESGSESTQGELLQLLAEHLPQRFPESYRRGPATIDILPADISVPLTAEVAPLATAARLVGEDLVLMQRSASGWRLVAASLCFPSSWRLADKFGRALADIHTPVPDFGAGTRNAELMARIFDTMRPQTPMLRWNWSLYGDAALYHPESPKSDERRFGPDVRADSVFLRVERQTLRKLPVSGDIVFTIGVHVDPLDRLAALPEAPAIAAQLVAQLAALTPEQLAYKGLAGERERLLQRLGEIAER